MNETELRTSDDLPKLRTSDFMDLVKNATNEWALSNARSLLSLEDRLKLFPTGNDLRPVHIYIQAESVLSTIDRNSLPAYEAAACEAYNRGQKKIDVIRDDAPAHPKMPLPPKYAAQINVRKKVGEWIEKYRALRQFKYLVQVLPLDSGRQIDIFVPYKTTVPEESREYFKDLRMKAQRVYSILLRREGISTQLPVVSISAVTDKPYLDPSYGKSATIH